MKNDSILVKLIQSIIMIASVFFMYVGIGFFVNYFGGFSMYTYASIVSNEILNIPLGPFIVFLGIDLALMFFCGWLIFKSKLPNLIKAISSAFPLMYLNEMLPIGLFNIVGEPGLSIASMVMFALVAIQGATIKYLKQKWKLTWHYSLIMVPVILFWLFDTLRWFMSG